MGAAVSRSRTFRPLDRRQRFEVSRDRAEIFGREFGRLAHHGGHRSADGIAVGHVSGFENALDVALRVVADSGRRDVGNPPVAAFRIRTAGEALARNDGAETVAGTVALGTMTRAVDQIGTAIYLRRLRWIGLELPAVKIKEFPASQQAADLEIERQLMVARLALDRGRVLR